MKTALYSEAPQWGDAGNSICGTVRRPDKVCGAAGILLLDFFTACRIFCRCLIEKILTEFQAGVEAVIACLHCGNPLLGRLLLYQKTRLFPLCTSLLLQPPVLTPHVLPEAMHILTEPLSLMILVGVIRIVVSVPVSTGPGVPNA